MRETLEREKYLSTSIGQPEQRRVVNNSLVGIKVSYDFTGRRHYSVSGGETRLYYASDYDNEGTLFTPPRKERHYEGKIENEITFGMGYFTERAQLITEAQALVSDGELQKGVKAFFVTSSSSSPNGDFVDFERRIIPQVYPGSEGEFYNLILQKATYLSPDKHVQKPHRR